MSRVDQNEEKELSLLIASMISNGDFWNRSEKVPSKIGFQRFGLQLREEDFEQQGTLYRGFLIRDRSETRKESSGFSLVRNEEKEFCIELDVWPFKGDELMVVVVPGLYVMIDGEQPEKYEDYSVCTRKFTRRYLLPKGCRSETMTANYYNFVLMVRVDKNGIADEPRIPRRIDINLRDWSSDKGQPDQRKAGGVARKKCPIADDILRSGDKAVKDAMESSEEEFGADDDLMEKKMDEKTIKPAKVAPSSRRKEYGDLLNLREDDIDSFEKDCSVLDLIDRRPIRDPSSSLQTFGNRHTRN